MSAATAGFPADSVGLVTPRRVPITHPLTLDCGRTLPNHELMIETYGQLNAARSNAVLICHALSGDHHAAGYHEAHDRKPGWWDSCIGPGKPIDTNRFHVVCLNNLGGCQGSTGPNTVNPDTGRPWGPDFPLLTVRDWVRSQALLSDALGIRRWAAVVGGSLGGMQVMQWAIDLPERIAHALVIAAAPQDYDTLRGVIQQLDVPRPQVLVEAIIFEISLNKARELGIELQGGTSVGGGNGVLLGQTNFQNIGALSSALTTGDTSALAAVPGLLGALVSQQTIQLPDGTEVPAGIAMISALEGSSDINVLSAPNILTSDNEEAEIVVGQNVPFVSSRSTNETNLANTFSQIDRRDVGITLRLTPQITQGDSVRLFVFQEVSALVPTSEAQVLQLGPTTSLRSATTTVVVGDGESVAIGGLINDRWTDTDQGVPFLSEIPVLGQLFSFETKMKEKVNLIILLTPRIVQNQREMRVVADDSRYRFRDSVQGRGGRFAGTLGSLAPNRLRSLPAEEPGVLLPPVDMGATY